MAGPLSTGGVCGYLGSHVGAGVPALVLHETSGRPLAGLQLAGAESILLLVGPEGGVSDPELDALTAVGAVPVRLGPTVLRTSTAAAVALGALGVLTPRWSIPETG